MRLRLSVVGAGETPALPGPGCPAVRLGQAESNPPTSDFRLRCASTRQVGATSRVKAIQTRLRDLSKPIKVDQSGSNLSTGAVVRLEGCRMPFGDTAGCQPALRVEPASPIRSECVKPGQGGQTFAIRASQSVKAISAAAGLERHRTN